MQRKAYLSNRGLGSGMRVSNGQEPASKRRREVLIQGTKRAFSEKEFGL
jgi:hypothetical protein